MEARVVRDPPSKSHDNGGDEDIVNKKLDIDSSFLLLTASIVKKDNQYNKNQLDCTAQK